MTLFFINPPEKIIFTAEVAEAAEKNVIECENSFTAESAEVAEIQKRLLHPFGHWLWPFLH
jgi:hypothetical protein